MADPLTIDKTPTQDQSMNKPESGTYGERVEVERLKKELPSSRGPGAPQPAEGPQRATPTKNKPAVMAAPPPAGPPGLPDVLMHPGAGGGQPRQQQVQQRPGAVNVSQARIALLDALSSSREVSDETREWASLVLEMLLDGTRT